MKLSDLQALYPELNNLLTDSHLQQLRQHGPALFSLGFYAGSRYNLQLDLNRAHPSCLISDKQPAAVPPDSLTMALRGQLENARLTELELLPDERILVWHFQSEQPRQLVTELSGRHANLFLLDQNNQILQSLYPDRSQRGLRRGSVYQPPAARPLPDHLKTELSHLSQLPADGSRSAAYAQLRETQQAQNHRQQIIQQGLKSQQRRLLRAQKSLAQLQADLTKLDEANLWQRRGELLQGAYGKVSRGAAEVTVPDYYQPDSPLIIIQLDPSLDLASNIQRCFDRSRKYERAAERALELIEAAEAQVQTEQTQLQDLSSLAKNPSDLNPEQLQRFSSLIPAPVQQKPKSAEAKPYREFLSGANQAIYVGRSAKENAQLTFKVARGNDLWLHIRDYPGSHVIVPLRKNEQVQPETLLDAATLAHHYSKADGPAEVNYTRRKHVQRFKGGSPGQVQLSEFKTLLLRPEPERLERLIRREGASGAV